MKRINVTLDIETLTILDRLAVHHDTTRSGAIRIAAREAARKEHLMSHAENIRAKLGLTRDELESLFAAGPVGGYLGTDVASSIASQHGLDLTTMRLGQGLADAGILTEEEADWLDDAD